MNPSEHIGNSENAGFSMPKGYFASSAAALQNRMEWLEEHRAFPALKMAWRATVFSVPENYFEQNELTLEHLPYDRLTAQRGRQAFEVPGTYFEEQKGTEASIRLSRLRSEQVFEVPATYFKNLDARLKIAVQPKEEARILRLNTRRFSFAAAAALLITCGWWTFKYFSAVEPVADCGGIACVDRREILQVKNLEMLNDEELLDVVNAVKLEKALQQKIDNPSSDTVLSEEDLLDNL